MCCLQTNTWLIQTENHANGNVTRTHTHILATLVCAQSYEYVPTKQSRPESASTHTHNCFGRSINKHSKLLMQKNMEIQFSHIALAHLSGAYAQVKSMAFIC